LKTSVPLGNQFVAHSSGALWIPASQSLLIADLHLGYSWTQRRRGQLGPLADDRARDKLFTVVRELAPSQIVFLGDLVHAPRPSEPERAFVEDILLQVSEQARLIAVRGNHDRAFAQDFNHLPIQTVDCWSAEGVTAIHGDRLDIAVPENDTLLIGHLHPALGIEDAAGVRQKLPLFLHCCHCIVLPAFSPFAAGFDVSRGLPKEIAALFRDQQVEAIAVSGKRAVQLGFLHEALARFYRQPPRSKLLRRKTVQA
jgi:uncharacterized protein